MPKPVGVSILTNGERVRPLKQCIHSLLENCCYRPLVIGVLDNGSTDETREWLKICEAPGFAYGVTVRVERNESDRGCAVGQNQAATLTKDCEYSLHLESDFELLPESLTGEDKMWLHRVVAFMDTGRCDYLYLRRIVGHVEMMMHWWPQWMVKIDMDTPQGPYLRCPGFWWSNNPHLRRNKVIYETGCLPMDETKDAPKGQEGWCKPELENKHPPNPWLHRWGLFVHERSKHQNLETRTGCGHHESYGSARCKFGFFKDGKDSWCELCDHTRGYEDMPLHERRFRDKYNLG